jgi:hypothetical protein
MIMTLNKIRYNPAASTLSVADFTLKSSHTQSILLRIESTYAGESGILLHRKGKLTIASQNHQIRSGVNQMWILKN